MNFGDKFRVILLRNKNRIIKKKIKYFHARFASDWFMKLWDNISENYKGLSTRPLPGKCD